LLTILVACLGVEEFADSTIVSNREGGSFRALTSCTVSLFFDDTEVTTTNFLFANFVRGSRKMRGT
jgi:hypothetical protein